MPHVLKNKNLEVKIDLPLENYNFSRFDWTGKIIGLKFQDIQMSTIEKLDCENEHHFGKGFYNEFGIDTALGFEETPIGSWFHKIGVGLLKKEDDQYLFSKNYKIKPAEFKITSESDKLFINCNSESVNAYSYILNKVIELNKSGFTIRYELKNTGEKDIITDEYVHNFTAINDEYIDKNYVLNFPFQLKPELFGDKVNPNESVNIRQNNIGFKATPKAQFFFSHLSGREKVEAKWELINHKSELGIREIASFKTQKVNLWGWKHVISPELFFKISIKPGQSVKWSRRYEVFKVN